jgi:hypothetical protein
VNVNSIFLRKSAFWLSGLAALAVVGGTASAHAQTTQPEVIVETTGVQQLAKPEETTAASVVVSVPQQQVSQSFTILPNSELPAKEQIAEFSIPTAPKAVAISAPSTTSPTSATPTAKPNQIAQSDIDVGRSTRGGSSYLGAGVNIGLNGGSSALGDGNFTILSKIGLTRTFSARPSILLGDNATILLPLTYDFSFQSVGDPFSEPLPIAPYLGVGAAIRTGDDTEAAFLVTGGVDVPLNNQFTATAAVNAGFFNNTDIGLLLGVGYNFSGF